MHFLSVNCPETRAKVLDQCADSCVANKMRRCESALRPWKREYAVQLNHSCCFQMKTVSNDIITRLYHQQCCVFFSRSLSVNYRLCVVNSAPSEIMWWGFTTNHRTSFTDKMRMPNRIRLIVQPYSDVPSHQNQTEPKNTVKLKTWYLLNCVL